jgi:hypothetical protein
MLVDPDGAVDALREQRQRDVAIVAVVLGCFDGDPVAAAAKLDQVQESLEQFARQQNERTSEGRRYARVGRRGGTIASRLAAAMRDERLIAARSA